MTLFELNQHRDLVEQLRDAEEQVAMVKAKTLGAANMDGMPHGTEVGDKTGSLAMLLAKTEARRDRIAAAVDASQKVIMDFLDTLPDSRTYNIFFLRFIAGMEWGEVTNIVGGFRSIDAIKASCYRFLKDGDEQLKQLT